MNENPFAQTGPYRTPPAKPPEPVREMSAAELKAKVELLEMFSQLSTRNGDVGKVGDWLRSNPHAESLKNDSVVLSFIRPYIINRIDDATDSAMQLLCLFPGALDAELKKSARNHLLMNLKDGLANPEWGHDVGLLNKYLDAVSAFGLTQDREFLGVLVTILLSCVIKHPHEVDAVIGRIDVPDEDGRLSGWLKGAAERILLDGEYPKGILDKYPEFTADGRMQEAAKLFVRKRLLASSKNFDFDWINEKFGGVLFLDPDVRRAMQLRKAALESQGKTTPKYFSDVLTGDESREAGLLSSLNSMSAGLDEERIVGHVDNPAFKKRLNISDPRLMSAARKCLYSSGRRGSVKEFIYILDRFPDLALEDRIRSKAKEIALYRIADSEAPHDVRDRPDLEKSTEKRSTEGQ